MKRYEIANGRASSRRKPNLNPNGYLRVYVPGHPCAHKRGWALEHRYVWHEAHGPIPPGHIIHHKNEDKTDNRIENLECMSKTEHDRSHIRENLGAKDAVGDTRAFAAWRRIHSSWNKGTGRTLTLVCPACGNSFQRDESLHKRNLRDSVKYAVCSRPCHQAMRTRAKTAAALAAKESDHG